MVGGPRGRRVLILYINCIVIEGDAGGYRASLKLMVQLEAAEETGHQDSSPRGCSRRICRPANKGFLEWAGTRCQLLFFSGCA